MNKLIVDQLTESCNTKYVKEINNMKAIVSMNQEELNRREDIILSLYNTFGKDGTPKSMLFEELHKSLGYAHYTFEGKLDPIVAEKLGRMPTLEELIILVDSGRVHFGASCSLNPDGTFVGRVNTD